MDDNASLALPDMSDEEQMEKNKNSLLAALKNIGAKRATVSYSGGGDSGYADEVHIEGQDGTSMETVATVAQFAKEGFFLDGEWHKRVSVTEYPLTEALTGFSISALWHHHSGWENGEGGYGEVVFDPDGGKVCLRHNEYYVDTSSTEAVL